jgi:hypothetical protein
MHSDKLSNETCKAGRRREGHAVYILLNCQATSGFKIPLIRTELAPRPCDTRPPSRVSEVEPVQLYIIPVHQISSRRQVDLLSYICSP